MPQQEMTIICGYGRRTSCLCPRTSRCRPVRCTPLRSSLVRPPSPWAEKKAGSASFRRAQLPDQAARGAVLVPGMVFPMAGLTQENDALRQDSEIAGHVAMQSCRLTQNLRRSHRPTPQTRFTNHGRRIDCAIVFEADMPASNLLREARRSEKPGALGEGDLEHP